MDIDVTVVETWLLLALDFDLGAAVGLFSTS